jgi:hypothetical protein
MLSKGVALISVIESLHPRLPFRKRRIIPQLHLKPLKC